MERGRKGGREREDNLSLLGQWQMLMDSWMVVLINVDFLIRRLVG